MAPAPAHRNAMQAEALVSCRSSPSYPWLDELIPGQHACQGARQQSATAESTSRSARVLSGKAAGFKANAQHYLATAPAPGTLQPRGCGQAIRRKPWQSAAAAGPRAAGGHARATTKQHRTSRARQTDMPRPAPRPGYCPRNGLALAGRSSSSSRRRLRICYASGKARQRAPPTSNLVQMAGRQPGGHGTLAPRRV